MAALSPTVIIQVMSKEIKMSVVCADGMTAITPTSPTAITSQEPQTVESGIPKILKVLQRLSLLLNLPVAKYATFSTVAKPLAVRHGGSI